MRKSKCTISISAATDPYQPVKKEYKLTRKILQELKDHPFSIGIQTKSSLVTRDIDIFKDIWDIEVSFTITTLDEEVKRVFEPYSSPIKARFSSLEALSKEGIRTWVFIGPILPYFTSQHLPEQTRRRNRRKVNKVKDIGKI
jgi:DNA repair photolyase